MVYPFYARYKIALFQTIISNLIVSNLPTIIFTTNEGIKCHSLMMLMSLHSLGKREKKAIKKRKSRIEKIAK